ncbi:RusA family crossover junction endodeoxyribonuclease [Alkaliphilus sp. B6464]|nr:RusA family crossover junction endodeoxyribonuclease [Alkaliphilus sp. B6464]
MGNGRHRITKEGIVYTPSKTINYENLAKYSFIESTKTNNSLLEGPLHMEIKAYLKIPKSATRKQNQQMIEELIRPTKRPDVDNI